MKAPLVQTHPNLALTIGILLAYATGLCQGFVFGWTFSSIWYRDGAKAAWQWLRKKFKHENGSPQAFAFQD